MAFLSNSSPERATAFAAEFGREPPQLDPSSSKKGDPMSLLKTINPKPLDTPRESKAAPDRLVSGDPSFKTWAQDTARDGMINTGVWEATPGETRSIKGETFEFCHVLDGVVELTEDGGETVTYRAGDSFVMKPGFTGTWRTVETVRKIYVTVT
jgi:uncharacterized cupin superfamily protein